MGIGSNSHQARGALGKEDNAMHSPWSRMDIILFLEINMDQPTAIVFD